MEKQTKGFQCLNCGKWVEFLKSIGTEHRNHCPFCLWSKHVDLEQAGDRNADCKAGMKPIGLTFKQEGIDKYGKQRQGEIMLIHECVKCGKININRLAGDDAAEKILDVLEQSKKLGAEKITQLAEGGIRLLKKEDELQVRTQLFGKEV